MPRRQRVRNRSLLGPYPEPEIKDSLAEPEWPCPHFPLCGGCQMQHIAYEEQVALKAQSLSRLFGRDVQVTPAVNPFHYRARMDYVTTFQKVGLRRRGNFRKIVDITDCQLISQRGLDVLRAARRLTEETGIAFYDINRREGFLKYITLRMTRYGEIMVIIYTNPGSDADHKVLEQYITALREAEWIDSVWWLESEEISDRTQGRRMGYYGAPYIIEELHDMRFAIGPETFFQSNTDMAEKCFEHIRSEVRGERVLDLYCGVGSITLCLSLQVSEIVGVESVAESIAQADENAARNHVTNARFVTEEVREFMRIPDTRYDTIVLDPPRAGIGGKVARRLMRMHAPRIVYMSCNPKTQMVDLKRLPGYKLESIVGYDMFPQTEHVETVAVLVREK